MQSGWVHESTDLTIWCSLLQNLQEMKYNENYWFSSTVADTVLHSNLWKDYLHMHPLLEKEMNSNKKGRFHTVTDKSTDVCVCVYSMNFPLSQQGLNTHRVNIIGLNRGRVDIGLVWARDFIFLSLTLVFAGCNLNSIGVICLSKGKTGTRRSWVCAHRNQGNSIRRHSYCVWGWDSSVATGGIRLE